MQSRKTKNTMTHVFQMQDVRALLVDDNSVNLMAAEGMLRQYGIGVVTATGGQDNRYRRRIILRK